ncbi:MAG TPA: IS200/IS605 family transposase [Roseiflexaceae bacterium]|nr:IS200/IS605 family transposase [Roseiflexaceae bacterium]
MAFWRAYHHLVWPTRHRAPLVTDAVEERLYPYLIKRAVGLDVYVYAINGWHDHVHLALAIPPKLAVADAVKDLKGASTHYINHELEHAGRFAWARGYGVFTYGERQRAIVEAYILHQKQHHADQTTNRWLEHATEHDEGPIVITPDLSSLHEEAANYDVLGEPLI